MNVKSTQEHQFYPGSAIAYVQPLCHDDPLYETINNTTSSWASQKISLFPNPYKVLSKVFPEFLLSQSLSLFSYLPYVLNYLALLFIEHSIRKLHDRTYNTRLLPIQVTNRLTNSLCWRGCTDGFTADLASPWRWDQLQQFSTLSLSSLPCRSS